jgi:predicted ester cyclase
MTNKELAIQWFGKIDKKDFAGLKAQLAPSHRFTSPMGGPLGVDEHVGMVQMMTGALQGGHTLDRLIAEGDYVAVSGKYRGKHVAEFMGVPATGKQVEFSFIDILHFENGKITDEHIELNPASIMAQIGALEAAR